MATQKCRCRACWARQTLAKPLKDYVRPPKCKSCSARKLFVAKDRLPKNHGRKKMCQCNGYHFPHRRGSKWCYKNPNIEQLHQTEERKAA